MARFSQGDEIEGLIIKDYLFQNLSSSFYSVYKDESLRNVTLKCPSATEISSKEKNRYYREYNTLKNINIDGVIQAENLVDNDNVIGLVLSAFNGDFLKDYIDDFKVDTDLVLHVFIKLLDILEQLHESLVIHRNLNSFSVLYQSKGQLITVSDFGISSVLNSGIKAIKGSDITEAHLAYISPEQTGRTNRLIDHRSDLYSAGVIFYEMLTGTLPFEADDPLGFIHHHIASTPTPPIELNAKIPRALSDIAMKILMKNPEDRYQSARGIRWDLESLVNHRKSFDFPGDFRLGTHDKTDDLRISRKLYGRSHELDLISQSLKRVSTEGSEVFMLSGPSGIGKTHLVRRALQTLDPRETLLISGKFDQVRSSKPYSAFINAFRDHIRQILSESDSELLRKKERISQALYPNGRLLINFIPEMAFLIDSQPEISDIGPRESENRFAQVFKKFILSIREEKQPLIIFLDDLQWADPPTLKLIEVILLDTDVEYVFLLGTYRNNEVEEGHPLLAMLQNFADRDLPVTSLNLSPLLQKDIVEFLADTLSVRPDSLSSLSSLVHEKSQGNPFFAGQYLSELDREGLLLFNPTDRNWDWNTELISLKSNGHDITDIMNYELEKLSEQAREIVSLASCIGVQFDLEILCETVGIVFSDVLDNLKPLLHSGLIVPIASQDEDSNRKDLSIAEKSFEFAHDKVQSAAYRILDKEKREILHLELGRRLFKKAGNDLHDKVFEIVSHINIGRKHITEKTERSTYAELNIHAAQLSRESLAYDHMNQFLSAAIDLLGDSPWTQWRNLTVKIYKELILCKYLLGDNDGAQNALNTALHNSTSDLEKSEFLTISMIQKASSGSYIDALESGIKILKNFEINLPQLSADLSGYINGEIALISELEKLLVSDELKDEMVIKILATICDCAIIGSPGYLRVLTKTMLNYSLIHGFTSMSPFALVCHAIVLASEGEYRSGFAYGEFALELNRNRIKNPAIMGRLLNMYGGFIAHLNRSFLERWNLCTSGYESCLETGDFVYAAYNICNRSRGMLFAGENLDKLVKIFDEDISISKKLRNDPIADLINMFKGFVLNISGLTESKTSFDHKGFQEKTYRNTYSQENVLIPLLDTYKLRAFYILEDFEKAEEIARNNLFEMISIQVEWIDLIFYSSLVLSRNCRDGDHEILQRIEKNHEILHELSSCCPENFRAYKLIIEAEISRIRGHELEAIDLYDEALKNSADSGLLHVEALANELAANYWERKKKEAFRDIHLRKAYQCYRQWGAFKKLSIMEDKYAFLGEKKGPELLIQNAPNTEIHFNSLDFTSITKASQAISQEIDLPLFLSSMIKIIIESAGAQRGVLVLSRQGRHKIVAEAHVGVQDVNLVSSPLEGSDRVSSAIVRYVLRTGETVILKNAQESEIFGNDSYISQQRSKSLLCTPMTHKRSIVGALFIENRLSEGVFTQQRLEAIQILLIQSSISLENAHLFEEIKSKVSELKDAEGALKESQERYRSLVENIDIGILLVDRNFKILMANNAVKRMFQGKLDSLIGTTCHETIRNTKERCKNCPAVEIYTGRFGAEIEREITRKDGSQIDIRIRAFPTYDSNENINGFIEVIEDITVKKKLSEKMKRVERMEAIGTLAGGLAHDFNNLLMAIQGEASLMLNTMPPDHPHFSGLKNIDQHVKSGSSLTKQLLGYARKGKYEVRLVDMNEIILKSILTLKRTRKDLIVEDLLEEKLYSVQADLDQMKQVLLNLFLNAADAMPRGGKLTISTKNVVEERSWGTRFRTGKYIGITVQDTGTGMDAQTVTKIFDPFFTTKEMGRGTGLGLASVLGIVENHGGTIEVDSKPKVGTTFNIILPAIDAQRIETPRDLQETEDVRENKGTILLVDDEDIILDVGNRLLSALGYTVIQASSGEESLRYLKEGKTVDLVILDMIMPGMRGEEVFDKMRDMRPDIKVVLSTGYSLDGQTESLLEKGCIGFLQKPFGLKLLSQEVSRALKKGSTDGDHN